VRHRIAGWCQQNLCTFQNLVSSTEFNARRQIRNALLGFKPQYCDDCISEEMGLSPTHDHSGCGRYLPEFRISLAKERWDELVFPDAAYYEATKEELWRQLKPQIVAEATALMSVGVLNGNQCPDSEDTPAPANFCDAHKVVTSRLVYIAPLLTRSSHFEVLLKGTIKMAVWKMSDPSHRMPVSSPNIVDGFTFRFKMEELKKSIEKVDVFDAYDVVAERVFSVWKPTVLAEVEAAIVRD